MSTPDPRAPAGFTAAVAEETAPCPVCGGVAFTPVCVAQDYEYGLPGTFHVAECVGCGLITQNPRPPFAEIMRYYTETYEPFRAMGSSLVQTVRDRVLNRPRLKRYERLVGDVARIVDVGCGRGAHIAEMQRFKPGWTVSGVEPATEAAEIGRAIGLDIAPVVLEAAGLAAGAYDMAIMNHVLEHLPDPHATVAEVWRILKPGGWFVGEIPCPACVERAVFGRYWGGYHLPRHLSYFRRPQLERFLGDAGFIEISAVRAIKPSSWLLSMTNLLRARGAGPGVIRLFSSHSFLPLALCTPVAWTLNLFGSAPMLYFACRKPAGERTGQP